MLASLIPVEFRVLGPLEVTDQQGELVPLGGPKCRALLALLALRPGAVAPLASLVDSLWPQDPPKTAVKTIQTYAWRLRGALGPALVTRDGGYGLEVAPDSVDAYRFERLILAAEREHQGPQAVDLLDEAVGLWRGEPMADLRFSPALAAEATRLEELRLRAIERRVGVLLDSGRHDAVVGELEALVAEHPLRERLWEHLMVALYRSGRQAEALRAYQRARLLLVEEVGVEPGPQLAKLEEAILRQDPALAPAPLAVDEPAPSLPPMLARATDGVFVGRGAERRAIEDAWRQAGSGPPRVVLVSGEPGIGKTRLAAEVAAEVTRGGGLVVYGRCDQGGLIPFQPFVEALSRYIAHAPAEVIERAVSAGGAGLVRLLPGLAERVGDATRSVHGGEPDRYLLFQSLVGLLADASARSALLVVLDDLHWADEATLLLLRHLVRSEARLVVIATFRDTEAGDTLSEHLALLARDVPVVRVALAGLSAAEVAELARARQPETTEELARLVHEVTGGNAFFAGEVLRDLRDAAGAAGRSDLGVPTAARDVIERRLARLSPESNRVLELASVVGAEFEVGVVAAAMRATDDAVVAALDEAASARLVCESPGAVDSYRFSHVLARSALTARLSASRIARLHRDVAEVLERRQADEPGHLARLAHHLAAAGPTVEPERVVQASVRAAEAAIARFAYEDAVGHYERALAALDGAASLPATRRCDVLLGKGEAHLLAGQLAPGKDAFLAAADLARTTASASHLARAAIGLAGRRTGLVPESAEEALLGEALAALGPEHAALRVMVLARLSQWLAQLRDDQCRRLADEAMREARRQGDDHVVVEALVARNYSLHMPVDADEKLAAAKELQWLADRQGQADASLVARRHRIWALLQLGDPEVWAAIDEHAEQARRVRSVLGLMLVAGFAGLRAAMEGRFEEVEGRVEEMEALGRGWAEPEAALATRAPLLVHVRLLQGRLHELEPFLRAGLDQTPHLLPFRSALALVFAQTGRVNEAVEIIEQMAGHGGTGLPRNRLWSAVVAHLALAADAVRHPKLAEELYAQLLPNRGRNLVFNVGDFHGAVDHHLGELAGVLGRMDDARQHLEDAISQYERIGARPWVVLAHVALARVLLIAGSDYDRAAALLRAALSTAETLGMAGAEAEARDLLGASTRSGFTESR